MNTQVPSLSVWLSVFSEGRVLEREREKVLVGPFAAVSAGGHLCWFPPSSLQSELLPIDLRCSITQSPHFKLLFFQTNFGCDRVSYVSVVGRFANMRLNHGFASRPNFAFSPNKCCNSCPSSLPFLASPGKWLWLIPCFWTSLPPPVFLNLSAHFLGKLNLLTLRFGTRFGQSLILSVWICDEDVLFVLRDLVYCVVAVKTSSSYAYQRPNVRRNFECW